VACHTGGVPDSAVDQEEVVAWVMHYWGVPYARSLSSLEARGFPCMRTTQRTIEVMRDSAQGGPRTSYLGDCLVQICPGGALDS
jgi:hypothetical protein